MKKLLLIALLVIITVSGIDAQTYKWWAGGRTNFWVDDYVTSFSVAPEVGFHITPYITIATSLAYHAKKWSNSDRNSLTPDMEGFVVNPYVRYTTFKSGILLGFIDGGIELGLGDFEGFQVGFKPGIALLLTNRITAATQFGFVGYNDGNGIAGRSKGVGFDISGYCTTIAFFYAF
ncbi:MAG: hypothetical protein LBE79_06085 [Tannerella sp.]|jgi:hypothetical protein|nr:hypothetical protein [Tannerella sp.]